MSCAVQAGANPVDIGREIFLHGQLGSGDPLVASRGNGVSMKGAEAACVNCHQRSGLGYREGNSSVPPITGRYLFHPRAAENIDLALPFVEGIRTDRGPYTDSTLARAIRDGFDADGKQLNYLMPNFALGDADMSALIAYLNSLDQRQVPGVTDTTLHFATIITPEADPVKTRAMLSVINQFFTDKNAFSRGPSQRLLSTHLVMFKVNRRWQLHVWKLTGPPETWPSQLKLDFEREPVLAVISGIGGEHWKPIQDFCEQEGLPCLFPNVEAPPANADQDFYSLYFSRGVLLEAGLMAKAILKPDHGKPVKVVDQIYRAGDSGEAGARNLADTLGQQGIRVRNHVLDLKDSGAKLAAAIRNSRHAQAWVLWLRPDDISALKGVSPPHAQVFVSGLLGGLEDTPLPASWRVESYLSYPVGLPEERFINLDFALGWFRIRQIPVLDLRVQADTYLACGLLSEALSHMVDTFVPDFLVETLQNMVEHRIITGYYPRLSLSTGERFASKGGYLVQLSEPKGTRLAVDRGWQVP